MTAAFDYLPIYEATRAALLADLPTAGPPTPRPRHARQRTERSAERTHPMTAQPTDQPREFSTDDGETYERVDPGEFANFDDVDATQITDPGAAEHDGLADAGEH